MNRDADVIFQAWLKHTPSLFLIHTTCHPIMMRKGTDCTSWIRKLVSCSCWGKRWKQTMETGQQGGVLLEWRKLLRALLMKVWNNDRTFTFPQTVDKQSENHLWRLSKENFRLCYDVLHCTHIIHAYLTSIKSIIFYLHFPTCLPTLVVSCYYSCFNVVFHIV